MSFDGLSNQKKPFRPRFMKPVQSLNHIGIAVRSLDEHRSYYESVLGATFESIAEVAGQKVRIAFYRVGDTRLELLEPTDSESPIAKFIERRGEGLHHIAFTVDDLETRIAELKEQGVKMIDETPKPGSHDSRIAFLHPKSCGGVLTEFYEPSKP